MAISRNNLAAAVAGTLSVAVLAGCPNPGATNPSPSPSAVASVTPSATTSASPSAVPSGEATPAPVPSAATIGTTTVRGTVYDVQGKRLDGAKVTIKSLNPSNPFETTVDTADGAFVANGVPAGVIVDVTAVKSGYSPRVQKITLLPLDKVTNQPSVDFGSSNSTLATPDTYALTKAPEIIAVDPADTSTGIANDKLTVKLTVSEVLSSSERTKLANAIRVFWKNYAPSVTASNLYWVNAGDFLAAPLTAPAKPVANEFTASTNNKFAEGLAAVNLKDAAVTPGGLVYADSTFMGESATAATTSWDAEGKVVTLTFNIPQYANKSDETKYAITLNNPGDIRDQDGDAMALKPFRTSNSNESSIEYSVAKDTTKPTLVGARVYRNANDNSKSSELELTFSEPLAVYAGPDFVVSQAVKTGGKIPNFRIKVITAKNESDISKSNSDFRSANPSGGDIVNTFAALTDSGSSVKELNTAAPGSNFEMRIDKVNPKVMRIRNVASTDKFISDINAIRVYVSSVIDPAGNESEDSDTNIKTSTF